MADILKILALVFFALGIIMLILSIKYYKEKNVKTNIKELKMIDKETPNTNSNIETYRKAEGISVIDEKEENESAEFLSKIPKEANQKVKKSLAEKPVSTQPKHEVKPENYEFTSNEDVEECTGSLSMEDFEEKKETSEKISDKTGMLFDSSEMEEDDETSSLGRSEISKFMPESMKAELKRMEREERRKIEAEDGDETIALQTGSLVDMEDADNDKTGILIEEAEF